MSFADTNITKAIIALGSNLSDDTARQHAFDTTLDALSNLGEIKVSSVVVGKDFTAKTEHIYHNWVVSVALAQKTDDKTLKQTLKDIERICGRGDKHQAVPMDLDLLAYYDERWIIVKKRLPFKEHEKKGLLMIAPFLLSHP
ncbi:2-amino-4-hydroxy-6-hydroxymethyldihydropteridine diphosphokinase [Moraxella sp. VT-16-12]|uniref:2-amino-4-hydroxy-6- hydroxymethyldihydropteridine diphosphokinase n=1 Tax=Moraxella sp. VT-16-12 TaxID=2014877 RepID=UPI000B7C76D4|nr:2-amino-4-hydroxy-6-hydroxymethyldihydropteridine diphosphokinase [Moraxella sp. VT-16-12]TWV80519.1 hypothetical protein CEW93_009830 [Moraxella sp. VT-16-12]